MDEATARKPDPVEALFHGGVSVFTAFLLVGACPEGGGTPDARVTLWMLSAAAGTFGLCALGSRNVQGRRGDDGALHLDARGTTGGLVAIYGATALAALVGAAALDLSLRTWPLIPLALVAAAGFVRLLCAYRTRLSLRIHPAEIRPGEALDVQWSVTSPAPVQQAEALVTGRERVLSLVHGTTLSDIAVQELRLPPQGSVALPGAVMPSMQGGPHVFAWTLSVKARLQRWPDFALELPLAVRGALVGGAARPDEAPARAGSRGAAVVLDGHHRTFAPGESIAGLIAWERAAAPRRAQVRLVWHSREGEQIHHEIVHKLAIARLPRVLPSSGEHPYRQQDGEEQQDVALAATDQRRFRFSAPEAPYSYEGARFRVNWQLELVLDDEVLVVPVVVGPERRGLIAAELAASAPRSPAA